MTLKFFNVKQEHRRLLTNTIMLYLLQISGILFPLFTFPYLTRVVGPEKYGIIVFVNSFMIYFQQLIDFGFILYGTLLCSQNTNDHNKLSKVTFAVIQSKIILVCLGFLIIVISTAFLETFKDKVAYTFVAFIPLALNSLVPDFFFRGIEKMSIITYRSLFASTLYTILVFLLIKTSTDYIFIPIINSVTTMLVVVWSWIYVVRNNLLKLRWNSLGYVLGVLKEAFGYFLSRIASVVYGASNVFFLGLFGFSNTAIGSYGVANNLMNVFRSFFTPIVDSLLPYLSKNKDFVLVKKIFVILMPLIIVACVVLYFLSKPLVVLLCGSSYLDSVPIFQLMIPLIFLALPTYLLGYPILGAIGLGNKANFSVVVGSIFHICGVLFLFISGYIGFVLIIVLTIFTELIVLVMRSVYVYRWMKFQK